MAPTGHSMGVSAPAELAPEVADSVWVVVPAFDEEPVVGEVIHDLCARYANVVVVDDGSTDATAARAAAAGATVLRHVLNRGQGAAIQTGLEYALRRGAHYVVTFDADGQHDVDDIAALVAPIHAGEVDVVLGSRFLGRATNMPATRALLLKLAVLGTRVSFGAKLSDAHNGLRAFSRAAASRIGIRMDRMAHASEILDQIRQLRLRFTEVGVHVRYTEYSRGKGQASRDAMGVAVEYLLGRFL